jgi:hypothetical protein
MAITKAALRELARESLEVEPGGQRYLELRHRHEAIVSRLLDELGLEEYETPRRHAGRWDEA